MAATVLISVACLNAATKLHATMLTRRFEIFFFCFISCCGKSGVYCRNSAFSHVLLRHDPAGPHLEQILEGHRHHRHHHSHDPEGAYQPALGRAR